MRIGLDASCKLSFKRLGKDYIWSLVCVFMLIGVVRVSARAAVTWDEVVKKATTAKSYSLSYKYTGPKGKFKFEYKIIDPGSKTPMVRTYIVRGKTDKGRDVSHTIILYDPRKMKDKVLYKIGSAGVLPRKITHKDVVDTPFYQSIYGMIIDKIGHQKPKVVQQGERTMFKFPNYTVWANDKAEIVETRRIVDKQEEHRKFTNITWDDVTEDQIKF